MVMGRRLATIGMGLFLLSKVAYGVEYKTNDWLLSLGFSYDYLITNALKDRVIGVSDPEPLRDVLGGSVTLERGLFTPSVTHWFRVAYLRGTVSGVGFTQSVSYLEVLPLGATWWFIRSAQLDFGLSLGGGIGFNPVVSYQLTGATSSTTEAGSISPLLIGGINGRFWIGQYFSVPIAVGLRYYNPAIVGASVPLTSMSMSLGISWAIGGVSGFGKTYVEVLPQTPNAQERRKRMPTPRQKQRPTQQFR